MKRTYLDWAAAAPVSANALRAFTDTMHAFGNPSSPHEEGRASRDVLEDARVRIARLSGVKSDGVVFAAGATEANAIAILGHIEALLSEGRTPESIHVLYLPSAHASTRGCMDMLVEKGVAVEALSVPHGQIDLADLAAKIRPETALIALEAVCGETGTRFDTRGVRQVLDAKQGKRRIRMHADASQLPLVESFEITRIAADTLTLDSQKVGGMRGIGVLLAPRQVPLKALVRGGGQERGLRPGTPSPALACSFAQALEDAHDDHVSFAVRARTMREGLIARIQKDIEAIEINGGEETAPHILNLSLLGRDTDYLAALLDEAGFSVSTRSACATDEDGSNAVFAFTSDVARAGSTLRISWGPTSKRGDLERLQDALVRAVRFLDANTL